MATKNTKSTTTTTTTTSRRGLGKVLNMIGFIGIMFVAIALVLAKIFGGGALTNAMNIIAETIAYLITAIVAYYYVRPKRNVWYFIAFAVAVILIIIFMILR